mgnify:CR=1 FL=1
MEDTSRSKKSIKNLMYGVGSQFVLTLIPFITRTIFISQLGEAYLGVNSLFTSILSVLSLAELGIGNIVVYSLYKPLAQKETSKITALVKFYRRIYSGIALTVLVVGVALLPFLHYLVKLPSNMDHLHLYYFLFVLNSAVSYLYVYKTSIINADQKQYIVSLYTLIAAVGQNIAQIIILLCFKNFLLYLLVQLAFTFLLNVCMSRKADKLYGIKISKASELSKEEKRKIINDTKSMVVYKMGGTFLNSTDSIYISTLINTITVGLYTNYVVLENVLNKFINLIYDAMYASVGNLNTTNDDKKKYVFDSICLLFFIIGTIGFSGYYSVVNNVVKLWIGDKYCLDTLTVFSLSLRFYLPIILYPIWMYRNTTGLFKETQNILIYAGALNLLLSYVLGKHVGLAGIIFATSISRFFTSFWYEPWILYKKIFVKNSYWEYIGQVVFSGLVITLTCFCVHKIGGAMDYSSFIELVLKGMLCVFIPLCLYCVAYARSRQMRYLISVFVKNIRHR